MLLFRHWCVDACTGQSRQRSLTDAVAHIDPHAGGGDGYFAAERDLWPDAYSMDAAADQDANANRSAKRHGDEYLHADTDADPHRDSYAHAHAD